MPASRPRRRTASATSPQKHLHYRCPAAAVGHVSVLMCIIRIVVMLTLTDELPILFPVSCGRTTAKIGAKIEAEERQIADEL